MGWGLGSPGFWLLLISSVLGPQNLRVAIFRVNSVLLALLQIPRSKGIRMVLFLSSLSEKAPFSEGLGQLC